MTTLERARLAHPARRHRRFGDRKLQAMAAVPAFAECTPFDLMRLGAVADLIDVAGGTVLAEGSDLVRQWWMVLDGWLLAEGSIARTIPTGWSWVAPQLAPATARLTVVRDATLLVAPLHRLVGAVADHPRLGDAVRSTLVSGDV